MISTIIWMIIGLSIIFVGAIAFTALKRADRALRIGSGDDWDSEVSRELLFDNFTEWIKKRAEETPWRYKFWDESQPKLKNRGK